MATSPPPRHRPTFPQAPQPVAQVRSLSPHQLAYLKLQRDNAIQFVHPPSGAKFNDPKDRSNSPLPNRRRHHPASLTPQILSRDTMVNKYRSFSGNERVLDSRLRPRVEPLQQTLNVVPVGAAPPILRQARQSTTKIFLFLIRTW
jgi:hypothetical protein